MASVPSTIAAVTTPSPTTGESAHRQCPLCRRRMSSIKFDKHTICYSCRPVKCDISNRCSECKFWPQQEIEDYLRHRKQLESKSRKSKLESASASPLVSDVKLESNLKSVEAPFDVHQSSILAQETNHPFSAPSQVPDMPYVPASGVGGEAPSSHVKHTCWVGRSPDEVLESSKGTPPIPNVIFKSVISQNNSSSIVGSSAPSSLTPNLSAQVEIGTTAIGQPILSDTSHNVSTTHVSPDSLLFPFSTHSVSLPPPSIPPPSLPPFIASSPSLSLPLSSSTLSASDGSRFLSLPLSSSSFPPSAASSFSVPSSVSSSSSSSSFSLASYNAGLLGLSKRYRKVIKSFFRHNISLQRVTFEQYYPDMLMDFDKDHQCGFSVFLSSLQSSSSSPSLPLSSSSPVSGSLPLPQPPSSSFLPPLSAFHVFNPSSFSSSFSSVSSSNICHTVSASGSALPSVTVIAPVSTVPSSMVYSNYLPQASVVSQSLSYSHSSSDLASVQLNPPVVSAAPVQLPIISQPFSQSPSVIGQSFSSSSARQVVPPVVSSVVHGFSLPPHFRDGYPPSPSGSLPPSCCCGSGSFLASGFGLITSSLGSGPLWSFCFGTSSVTGFTSGYGLSFGG